MKGGRDGSRGLPRFGSLPVERPLLKVTQAVERCQENNGRNADRRGEDGTGGRGKKSTRSGRNDPLRLLFAHMHRPVRIGDINAFGAEAPEDPLPYLALDRVLVRELPDMADDDEIDRTLAEAGEPSRRSRFGKQAR